MVRKSFKFFLILLQLCIVCIIAAIGAFLWRLHSAPIEVNGIIPYIVHAFSPAGSSTVVKIDSAVLTWGKATRPVDLVAKNFTILNQNGGVITSVPEMSLSFSLLALLKGTIAPKTIAIYNPYLHLFISKEGKISSYNDERIESAQETVHEPSQKETQSVLPIRHIIEYIEQETYITEFSIINAKAKITDNFHDAVWDIPDITLTYEYKHKKNKLAGNVLLLTKTIPIALDIEGAWGGKRSGMLLSFSFKNINLSRLTIAQQYPLFKNLTTPVNISLQTHLNLKPLLKTNQITAWHEAIQRMDYTIKGGAGVIDLPAPIMASYDLKRFSAKGAWYDKGDKFDISSFEIELNNGRGFGNISVKGIGTALDTKSWESISAVMNTTTLNIPVDKLPSYWPGSITPDVHAWVKENLKGGLITEGNFTLHFAGLKNEPGIDSEKVQGTVKVVNTDITYMEGMPAVENVSGTVHLSRNIVDIDIDKGHTYDVRITGGKITFYDLVQKLSGGRLNLNLEGSLRDALVILNQPPLDFTKDMGIIPEKSIGNVTGNLQLEFPMGEAFISPEQIQAKATAHVTDAAIQDIVMNYGLHKVVMDLNVNGKEVNSVGSGLLYTSPVRFKLYQTFDKKNEIKSEIHFEADLNDKSRAFFDYDSRLLTPPSMTGVMKTSLHLKEKRDQSALVKIDMDLNELGVYWRPIGWIKPKNVAGSAQMELNLKNTQIESIPSFSINDKQGTLIKGKMGFNAEKKLQTIEANPVRTARTQAKARVRFMEDDVIQIDISGASLDLTGIIDSPSSLTGSGKKDHEEDLEEVTSSSLKISAVVDKIWLSRTGYANNAALYAQRQDDMWTKIESIGHVGEENIPFNFIFMPNEGENNYSYILTSGDAGGTLHAMDYISSIKGGKLDARGVYTPGIGSKGILNVSEFRMQEMPVFSRILMLTSFTGIVDLFKGEGLSFNEAEVPYEINESEVTVTDAVIAGSSLGITLNGKYYRDTGYLNLRGSLVPFYTINSFLGKIPLIGKIFSGEKGGGLIAPTYTVRGKLPSPDVSVNAFSALAPGAARSLFNKISETDADLSVPEETDEIKPEILHTPLKDSATPHNPEDDVSQEKEIPSTTIEIEEAEKPKTELSSPPLLRTPKKDSLPKEKHLTDSLQHNME